MSDTRLELEPYRVAGESKITLYLKNEEIKAEYSGLLSERLFERLIIGRNYKYAPYIAARICGVCSHAHFWASNLAIENALGVEVDEVTAELRDICNKLQIIENHLVHLAFLALPDYKNLEPRILSNVIKAREILKNSLNTLCGRLSGPQPYMPGGFLKEISRLNIERTIKSMENLAPIIDLIVNYVLNNINMPSMNDPSPTYLALYNWPERSVPTKEPYVLISNNTKVNINSENYLNYFNETKPAYSNSKTCVFNGQVFFVGARARILARKYVDLSKGLLYMLNNPYGNIVAKAIETQYLVNDVINKLRSIAGKSPRRTLPSYKKGKGLSVIEAPRGLLIHYYEIEEDGRISNVNILTPTVMFTKHVEKSVEALTKQLYVNHVEVDKITKYVEMLVRSYDPCIPCAVHVIKIS
ncbi:MAG: nickel-dependent hydrogenase large subunit [Desulfurococcaceae archaeon]